MALQPLMPKATAVWLIENTALTFDQISEFCGLHILEGQSIADDEVAIGMVGFDPIANSQLTQEEIDRCVADPDTRLVMASHGNVPRPTPRTKGPRYTPVARRQDKPDAIAWLVRNYPDLKDSQISRLVGTTKPTITAVRERTHWNMTNIKAQEPVRLDLCNRVELDAALTKCGYPTTMEQLQQAQAEADAQAVIDAAAAAEAEAEERARAEPTAETLWPTTPTPAADEADSPADSDHPGEL